MPVGRTIYVYEHDWLAIGQSVDGVVFEERHFNLLSAYLTANTQCNYFRLFNRRIKFSHYVGVIKIGDLSIEVLPKSDAHEQGVDTWRNVLLEMLAISFQVRTRTSTRADIQIRRKSVLETYIQLFIDETERIFREGPVKKYRNNQENQLCMKGKLMIHRHIVENLVHAERFFVSYQVYDHDNIFNALLSQTLRCIVSLGLSAELNNRCKFLLEFFPRCKSVRVSEKLFQRLVYSRKTERYRQAIELARIILLNYHPDLKGGSNNILAIMLDMNHLWESYIYYVVNRAARFSDIPVSVEAQRGKPFWRHPGNYDMRLRPDIVVKKNPGSKSEEVLVLDTKWKYRSDTSINDVRQMYAYGRYFGARNTFLLYPDRLGELLVKRKSGTFYKPLTTRELSEDYCGLIFIDLLKGNRLNKEVGKAVIERL
jgi:5-methylcytosine-specific restriction enzyme subunit McrC